MFEVSNDEFMTEHCGLLFSMVLALIIDEFVADFSPLMQLKQPVASLNLLHFCHFPYIDMFNVCNSKGMNNFHFVIQPSVVQG